MIDNNNIRIACWNVRGLNNAARREAVRLLLQKISPNIICLQETKLDNVNALRAAEFLRLKYSGSFASLDAQDTRGGILIAWDQDLISSGVLIRGEYSITQSCIFLPSNSNFVIIVVYGPSENDNASKDAFLRELVNCQPAGNTPWLCLGDFNLIVEARDKNNSNINRAHMRKFRRALDASELIEIRLQNRKYTWSNGQRNPTLVHLDRCFCNKDWEDVFPCLCLQAVSSSLSDHCPLLLCNHHPHPRPAVFRFEQFWVKAPGFLEAVQSAWDRPVRGTSPLMFLHNKLLNTSQALRQWSRSLFSQARLQLSLANEVILRLDIAQESRPLTNSEASLLRDLKHQVLGWAAIERSRRRQSSRMIRIREGDACTKFFHQQAKGRRRRNLILHLQKPNGELTWEHNEKEAIIFQFFSEILGTKRARLHTLDWERLDLPRLNEPFMDQPFTEDEIKKVVMELPAQKAPGPDGFTGTFYKVCWLIIKNDVIAALNSFYDLCVGPLDKLNGANIVLIPKSDLAERPGDFRPISLIHSFGKLITKALATRLSPHIGRLISVAQSDFVKRRCIHDNFMYVRNLARAYHRKKTPALLFKLDISKAFDTVSWEYILELLQHRGFSQKWCDWLASLFRTSHSTVLLNGVPGRQIIHARGLRQGDPLSPFLFILAIDTLQKVLDIATEDGFLSPLRGRHPKLRLSLYADDAVIFINPIQEEVRALLRILDQFGSTTGLRLNLAKCVVAPIRCAGLNLDEILDSFVGQRATFPMTYLGLPLTLGRLKVVHVQRIIDKARSKLAGWQGKLLNPAGCRELVRSVLSAIPIYLLTSLKPPKQLFKDIDKARRRFLWAGDSEFHGGKCKVAWVTVAKPILFGGLGIIDLEKFSRALRLRWLWFEWTNPERPWNGMTLPGDLALFNAATRITVYSGNRASFWHSCWIDGQAPAKLFPTLYGHNRKKHQTVREAVQGGN